MTARVCQLCGKPLSRLWVGGDGDYCSKEHRNQHRLRQGMDRLEEASKVTSLMRRRENPRQISAAILMRNTAGETRRFERQARLLGTQVAAFAPVLTGLASRPRVVAHADEYVTPRVEGTSGPELAPKSVGTALKITGKASLPFLPMRRRALGAKITQAPMVELTCDVPGPQIRRHDFGMPRGRGGRVHVGSAALTPVGAGSRRTMAGRLQPRIVPRRVHQGKALRVSIGAGFRVGKVSWRNLGVAQFENPALKYPDAARTVLSNRHDEGAELRSFDLEVSRSQASMPQAAHKAQAVQLPHPGSVQLRRQSAADQAKRTKRYTDVEWVGREPQSKGMAVPPSTSGFAKRDGARFLRAAVVPAAVEMSHQVAFTAFVPQEPAGCPKVAFEGAVAAAIVATPTTTGVEAPEAAVTAAAATEMVTIEEHFGEGWNDWVGGTAEWKVDVAGVRTGPLALYKPSLELIDYEIEFLARIDARSLTWVVRAAGLEEYVRCTLTAVGGGELEFSRCTVVGNVAGQEVRAAKRVPGKPRTTMTVGTRVTGDTFAVSVDGTDIDFWNDDRFPMGGVGFMGAPDDRARLYWVRLSSTELTGKEQEN